MSAYMRDLAPFFALWICCGWPLLMFTLGMSIGKRGGVRAFIASLLDRVGVPPLITRPKRGRDVSRADLRK